jgi:hypothetical protein
MDVGQGDVSLSRFAAARAAFESAWVGVPTARRDSHYCLAGTSVRMRIVGPALAEHIEAPLIHLRSRPPALAAPGLTIDLWDLRETGVKGLPAAERDAVGRRWDLLDGVFATSADGRIASHQLPGSVTWLDRRTAQLVGWFDDGRSLSLHQRAKPLQVPLAVWAHDRGLQAVHAAAVARGDRGVLIPGSSGSGKSTVALSCLEAGYHYLGDDWIGVAVAPGGDFVAHALYASALLDPAHATRFPHLQPHAIPPPDPSEPKALVLLARVFPARLGSSAPLCALALPRIVGRTAAACRPASKAEALRILAPSSIFTMRPRGGREGLERIARLVERLPAYWLDIGDDLSEIPRRIDEILARVGAAG